MNVFSYTKKNPSGEIIWHVTVSPFLWPKAIIEHTGIAPESTPTFCMSLKILQVCRVPAKHSTVHLTHSCEPLSPEWAQRWPLGPSLRFSWLHPSVWPRPPPLYPETEASEETLEWTYTNTINRVTANNVTPHSELTWSHKKNSQGNKLPRPCWVRQQCSGASWKNSQGGAIFLLMIKATHSVGTLS